MDQWRMEKRKDPEIRGGWKMERKIYKGKEEENEKKKVGERRKKTVQYLNP